MPLENFHVVHLAPFDEFVEDTVKTEYGGVVFGAVMPSDVWVRYAFHKTRGEILPFSIGFPSEKYSLEEVVEIMKNNNIPYMDITPASSTATIRAMTLKLMPSSCKRKNSLSQGAVSRLRVAGIARTSEPVLAPDGSLEYDDIETYTVQTLPIPIDYEHTFSIGRVLSVRKTKGNLYIKGEIISTDPTSAAAAVINGILSGVPYQLSIFATPSIDSVVEEGMENVDGKKVPVRRYKNYTLRGVAICSYGADGFTKVIPRDEEEKMSEEVLNERVEAEDTNENPASRVLSVPVSRACEGGQREAEEINEDKKEEDKDDARLMSISAALLEIKESLEALKEDFKTISEKMQPVSGLERTFSIPSIVPSDTQSKPESKVLRSVQSFARSLNNT